MKRFFSILESPGRDFLKSSLIVLVFVFAHALTCLLLHDFLACFAGFYIGTEGADLLERWIPSWGVWVNVIVTMVTTELLGLIIILLIRKNWNADKR